MTNTPQPAAESNFMFIDQQEMQHLFLALLRKEGMAEERARTCAEVFVNNSLNGVYTHGVNRFARFIEYIREGYVKADEKAICKHSAGAFEQWDGKLAPGPLNALQCTERSMALARQGGIGCVALSNTNHWMRGGTYGWKAAREGFIFIGWTNTIANMPAWGATDNKLGNNPLVLAVPYEQEAIVLDMAMSQYSYGSLEAKQLAGEPLAVPGGYTADGSLTQDPAAILESRRPVPAGYWKGAGLSLLLDVLATILSGGLSTAGISNREAEYGVSQVFITLDTTKLSNYGTLQQMVQNIITDYHASTTDAATPQVRYPGERVLRVREENGRKGIPVHPLVWHQILALK